MSGAALAACMLLGALAIAPAVLAKGHDADIRNFSFDPASITVAVGDTVTWENYDDVTHTATADDGSFDTGRLSKGQDKSVTFSTAGTFTYHCTVHPRMKATIVVSTSLPATDATAQAPGSPGGQAGLIGLIVLLAGGLGLSIGLRRFALRRP